jgi:hypothetical protein
MYPRENEEMRSGVKNDERRGGFGKSASKS